MLDTDVAIHLRDGDHWIEDQASRLTPPFFISAISHVELESGAAQHAGGKRRALLDQMLSYLTTLDFGVQEISAYRRIIETTGHSRRKTADRMTAATALVHGLTLVTLNGRDFRDVPGLQLLEWQRPAQ